MEISVINSVEETFPQQLVVEHKLGPIRRCFQVACNGILPNKKEFNLFLTQLLVLVFFAVSMYGILNKNALPGSEVFGLFLLVLSATVAGKIFGLMFFPPLLGMMIAGFLYRNLSFIPYYGNISHKTVSSLRDIALVLILLRAGLGLDPNKLKNLKMVVFRLTVIPCIVETASIAVLAHFLLDLPWIWATMLGFIISAVSPAVVLPILLNLMKKNLGTSKGIPTLIIAASSMDDILAIAGFTITLSIAFSEGNIIWTAIKAPLEPLVGVVFGSVFGVIFWHLPSKDRSKSSLIYYNILLLCFAGLSAMFASKRAGIPGSGALGCITLALAASLQWREDADKFHGISAVVDVMWEIIQPFLFALIGAEVTLPSLQQHVGYSVLALILGLCCRSLVTGLTIFGANLNIKEKIFVCCAWLPKATVQAAVGSQVLDYARSHNKGFQYEEYGKQILNIAVLSIVLTAPVGAALTAILGPILLSTDDDTAKNRTENADDDNGEKVKANKILPDYGSCDMLETASILPHKNFNTV